MTPKEWARETMRCVTLNKDGPPIEILERHFTLAMAEARKQAIEECAQLLESKLSVAADSFKSLHRRYAFQWASELRRL